ncbi:MAG: hypothetical protein IT423_02135, partial [Pirellulaceae bacterium]|nr:hypothetical protein [Pirellulaceae bacterium]
DWPCRLTVIVSRVVRDEADTTDMDGRAVGKRVSAGASTSRARRKEQLIGHAD